MKGFWPTPGQARPSMRRFAQMVNDAGWGFDPFDDLVTATALFTAESARDEKAYLAYVELPEFTNVEDPDGALLDEVKERIRSTSSTTPLGTFVAMLAAERTRLRSLLDRAVKAPVLVDVDRGYAQINRHWHPNVSDATAFVGASNLEEAHKIYVGWGRSFRAWSAYNNGAYAKHLKEAREACWFVVTGEEPEEPEPPKPPPPPEPPSPPGPSLKYYGRVWFYRDLPRFKRALRERGYTFAGWVRRHRRAALRVFRVRPKG